MKFLGIDQSYSGYATTLYDADTGDHDTLVRAFNPNKYFCEAARLADVQDHLASRMFDGSIYLAAMEGYAMGAKFGREKAGELGGATKLTLWAGGYVPHIVQPSALKKFVLGEGAGRGKNLMLKGVYKKWGVDFNDDNAADSYALARLAHMLHNPTLAEHKYEQAVIRTILKEGTK